MLYLIGLGLGGVKDLTIRGLEVIETCDFVFLEIYTSLCIDSPENISLFIKKPIKIATRKIVEENVYKILKNAPHKNVAFLVIGDPLSATTHIDIMIRAKDQNIPVQVIHNASIMNAIAVCGLQLYRFGECVSIVLWTETWKPESFYDKILGNYSRGLHTLCLLDIKIKELTLEGIMKDKKIYHPDFFQSSKEAADIILSIIKNREIDENEMELNQSLTPSSLCISCSRIGWKDQKIISLSLNQLSQIEDSQLGGFPHCLVIPAKTLHECEIEFLMKFTEFQKV